MSEARLNEALLHHEAGRIEQAQALYRGILARDPEDADSLHLLGLITAERGNPAAGAALIQRAMAIAPGRAPYHNNLALSYRLLGRGEDAVREYRTAVALRPQSAEIHNNLATTLRDLGRHEEALAHYRQAAEHAPAIAEIWYNLANALGEDGPAEEVEGCYRRAIALKPDYTHAQANYGRWLMTQARWEAAAEALGEAARLAPMQAPTWSNLGIALQEQGRAEEAEGCYRRALALAPRFAAAHYNLGCLLLEQGRTDEAAGCQQAALAADPQYGAALLALCMAQLPILYRTEAEIGDRRRRYAAALESLEAALAAPAAVRSLAAAVGTAQPFFLPYQGEDDRALQAMYGRLACRVLAATEPRRRWQRARCRGAHPGRHRQRLLLPAHDLQAVPGGLADPARPQPVRGDRLPHRPGRRRAYRARRRVVRPVVQGFPSAPRGGRRCPKRRRTCCCIRRSAWTRWPGGWRHSAWRRCSA